MNAVLSWLRGPFRLLDSKKARWQLVIFCGIFGCLFLNIFGPFNSDWFQGVETPLFFILTFSSAAGMAALALTQFAIRSLFRIQLTTRIIFFSLKVMLGIRKWVRVSIKVYVVRVMVLMPAAMYPEYTGALIGALATGADFTTANQMARGYADDCTNWTIPRNCTGCPKNSKGYC